MKMNPRAYNKDWSHGYLGPHLHPSNISKMNYYQDEIS